MTFLSRSPYTDIRAKPDTAVRWPDPFRGRCRGRHGHDPQQIRVIHLLDEPAVERLRNVRILATTSRSRATSGQCFQSIHRPRASRHKRGYFAYTCPGFVAAGAGDSSSVAFAPRERREESLVYCQCCATSLLFSAVTIEEGMHGCRRDRAHAQPRQDLGGPSTRSLCTRSCRGCASDPRVPVTR